MSRTVADVMTTDPYVGSRKGGVVEGGRMMIDGDVGWVAMVENGHLVGIITDRDLGVRVVAAGLDPNTTKVDTVATSDLHLAMPDEPLDDVLERMATWRVRRLPVVESEKLVGMLAQADLVHELKDKKAGQLVDEISQPGEPSYSSQEIGLS